MYIHIIVRHNNIVIVIVIVIIIAIFHKLFVDDDTGVEYFHHAETGRVQWESPCDEPRANSAHDVSSPSYACTDSTAQEEGGGRPREYTMWQERIV